VAKVAVHFTKQRGHSPAARIALTELEVGVDMIKTRTPIDLKPMAVPTQLPTTAQNETFGGVTYHIEGELVPALHLELSSTGVYFEHHILLWKDPAVQIELHPLKGAFKRMLAGMPFLLTGANGPGRIAFSRDGAGHVFALHLKPGMGVDVRQ
jgi:hypothetical protein